MPSSPGYIRNYKEEHKTAVARGETGVGHNSGDAERHRLRRLAIKKGMVKKGDKKDVDHRIALVKGGANTLANARVRSEHDNRSYPRNSHGGMIRNEPKT